MNPILIKKFVVGYILSAMISWVPLTNQYLRDASGHWQRTTMGFVQEDQTQARARYEAIARDIVDVSFDDNNTPLFKGADGRAKTALLSAAIGSLEGGYHKWVDDGTCNTAAFQAVAQAQHRNECDGGAAFSIWQIHIEAGYIFKDDELTQTRFLPKSYVSAHTDDLITKARIVADRHVAALMAYYLMRYSLHNYHSLCSYTGESCTGRHPLADVRLGRAEAYLRTHPFTMPSPEQLALIAAAPNTQKD